MLPIEAARRVFAERMAEGPVVVSSPTGSGKSTQVPRWLAEGGRVLVVEPRRVACRSLAQRVAELEDVALGGRIGYHVRDERRATDDTAVLFATPGIVLRAMDELDRFDAVVLDELHERRLDVDLLLAMLQRRGRERLVAMSATLDGDRVASHLDGSHVRAEGRLHPVDVRHVQGEALLPDVRGVEVRVRQALDRAGDDPGDVLVFLPGKAEIASVHDALRGRRDLDVIPLHGGLSLREQSRAFGPSERRKVILSTNVAETSVTVPGIGVVIDSGLVRRTRYHQGRGHLALVPIAQDSAEQRAGRAGRTAPGVCYRLWDPAAKLEASTPPEIHRESLVPLLLAAAACGERAEELPFLDPPKEHALDAARSELVALGALGDDGALTDQGHELFGLPLDAHLGRLLVEAKHRGTLEDAVDLVAALGVGRPLFTGRPAGPDDDLREPACDATATVRALRTGEPELHGLSRYALAEARKDARRLRRAMKLGEHPDPDRPVDREGLARTAMAADPRCVHVARRRKKHIGWSNGGTEVELARESAVWRAEDPVDAVAVLDTRAIAGRRRGAQQIIATCAMPLPTRWLVDAGLGRDRLARVALDGGKLVAHVERVYAKRVIDEREEEPTGALAREALRDLFVRGSIFPEALKTARERLEAARLAARLAASSLDLGVDLGERPEPPALEQWVLSRLEELGVERGEDAALLEPDDLLPPDLPYEVRHVLDKELPRSLDLHDAGYEVDYDLERRQVTLHMVRGNRRSPPPPSFLPRFLGMRVCVEAGGAMHVVREVGRR